MGLHTHATDSSTPPLGGFGSVRWLPAAAGLVALVALGAGASFWTSLLAWAVLGLALLLEVAGWHRAVHSDGRRLAIAALAGALSMTALIGWTKWTRSQADHAPPDRVATRALP